MQTNATQQEGLAGESAKVRIVRLDDRYTIIQPVAVGAIPYAMGKMYKNLCFDTACNSKMVDKGIAAEKMAAAPETEEQPATAAKSLTTTAKTTAATNASTALRTFEAKGSTAAQGRGCVKTRCEYVFRGHLIIPEVPIVQCSAS